MTIETTIAAVVGGLPWAGPAGITITSDTRPAVRTWLSRMGWKTEEYLSLPLDKLAALYTDHTSYLAHKDHSCALAVQQATASYAPRNESLLAYLHSKGIGAPPKPPTAAQRAADLLNQPPKAWTPQPPKATPRADNGDNADTARQLAELLAKLAGNAGAAPLDEGRVIALIREHAPKPPTVTVQITTKTPEEPRTLADEIRHEAFPGLLQAVGADLNVMIVGPAGCSKTHLCGQLAAALNLGFTFTGAIDSAYKLTGFMDAQGRIVSTAFRDAYENGKLFLFDETDASLPGALLAFNAALANGHMDFPDKVIEKHPNFRCVASANTFGRGQDRVYVGRNQLDAASLDRFVVEAIDYDENMERALYGDTPWTTRVHKVRAAVRKLNIRHVVSMRAIDQGRKLLAAGMSQDKVEPRVLWKGLDAPTVAKITAEAR
jgi:cobaltochelatase CobS